MIWEELGLVFLIVSLGMPLVNKLKVVIYNSIVCDLHGKDMWLNIRLKMFLVKDKFKILKMLWENRL